MSKYEEDRRFTNFIHEKIALKNIYQRLNWKIKENDSNSEFLDVHKGIDYFFYNKNHEIISVQERFRDKKYSSFNDVTIRYRRDYNLDSSRIKSEFYKMEADYHVYGIVNVDKNFYQDASNFIKFAVIDLNKIYEKIENKEIIIGGINGYKCIIKDSKLICPIIKNKDFSSSFFPIDVIFLHNLFKYDCIVIQKGYF